MEKYTNKEMDYHDYFNYVKEELIKVKSSGSKLSLDKMYCIDIKNLTSNDIREVCRLVEFMMISENVRIFLFHEWFRHLKN